MEKIKATIERITYSNEENGYSVLKVKIPGRRNPVAAVGNFISVTAGEVLLMEGTWGSHPRFGEQFKVERYETAMPATAEGIRKYLGSGLVKGIGPKMADRIVKRFGVRTLDIIEKEPERLGEIEGIGPGRRAWIAQAWEEQRDIRDVMIFLRGVGVGAGFAARIFKTYGKESLGVLHENPYRLATDVAGIGFLTADQIAGKLGIPADSAIRAEAGILFALHKAADEGHVCLPREELLERSREMLGSPREVLEGAVSRLIAEERLAVERLAGEDAREFGGDEAVYLKGYQLAETLVARRLAQLLLYSPLGGGMRQADPDEALVWLRERLPFTLAPHQEDAVRKALVEKVVIVTGGPGTGKTTLVRAIIAVFSAMGARIVLGAPTGRAAKRLAETTRHAAGTLHRLLEFSPRAGSGGGFLRNEQKPLNADLVIVDEVSMVDILLMHHFLKAVPARATLVLVGDADQLPSVGPGNVLRDLIESERVPVVRLTQIFRQARRSRIVLSAHRVREGKFPLIGEGGEEEEPGGGADAGRQGLRDFYFIEKDDPAEAAEVILKLCRERIPTRFGFDPVEEVQVLSPMHRGEAGVQRLNTRLQELLNPSGDFMERGGHIFRVNDKVMQIRNNYDKDVFNGDMGRIREIDTKDQQMRIDMDGRLVTYEFSELDEIVHAYAVSVHKSQGSEYPAVVIPVLTQHYVMLQRNLLYTAITRARKLAVLVGSKKALALAVRSGKVERRNTLLRKRLRDLIPAQAEAGGMAGGDAEGGTGAHSGGRQGRLADAAGPDAARDPKRLPPTRKGGDS